MQCPKPIPILALLALAQCALANGVLEISQACAEHTGCGPGDAPGFPVTITESGSYRLTSNLRVADGNTTAIALALNTSFVTLDLGGFVIRGPNQIPFGVCSHPGTGIGIAAPDFGNQSVVVRNGAIVGMGARGLSLLGLDNRVESVTAAYNCGDGINVSGDGGTIVASSSRLNMGSGFNVSTAIRDSFATNNLAPGITVSGVGTVVSGNVVKHNEVAGILLTSQARPAVIAYNTVYGNQGVAIGGGVVTLVHNMMYSNDGPAYGGSAQSGVGENTYLLNFGGADGAAIGCNAYDGVGYCPSHP